MVRDRTKVATFVRTSTFNVNHLITDHSYETQTKKIAPDGVLVVAFLSGPVGARSWIGVIRSQEQYAMLTKLCEEIVVEALIVMDEGELREITKHAEPGTLENGALNGYFSKE